MRKEILVALLLFMNIGCAGTSSPAFLDPAGGGDGLELGDVLDASEIALTPDGTVQDPGSAADLPPAVDYLDGFLLDVLDGGGQDGEGLLVEPEDVPDVDPCAEDDEDCDGIPDSADNCPEVPNLDQIDTDEDEAGDACDEDDDDDGVMDPDDAFPLDPEEWSDVDGDGIGDNADIEECDGVDNDGDGLVDEELPLFWYYPDADGDGYGAAGGSSCASLLAQGVIQDGVYDIDPDFLDGPALSVYCDMTTDGGGWTLIFYHDIADGYYASDEEAHELNVDDPLSLRYSILSYLEAFRSSDNTFEFRINWPDTDIPGRNIWHQTSDPTTGPVVDYVGLEIDYTNQHWGGLELSAASTYLDGSANHNNWFYSVGSQVAWSNPPGIPAYEPRSDRVALWVRPDDALAGGAKAELCGPLPGYAEAGGDCDDSKDYVNVDAVEVCNGFDDNCDGSADDDCPFGDLDLAIMPKPLHFYARNLESDSCTFKVSGEMLGAASQVQVLVTREGEPAFEATAEESPFAFDVTVEAGLHLYDVVVSWDNESGWWKTAATESNILCGDVFVIDGQSNAVAIDYHNEALGDLDKSTFVRSFGSSVQGYDVVYDANFGIAVANAGYTHAAVGQWGLQLALDVMETQQMPILLINGAVGGTKVDQHQRKDFNKTDLTTIYGRLLWRVQAAGVAETVRAIFWHQGESDGNMAFDEYLGLWTSMYEDWLDDYPNVEGVYPFQVRAGCGGPTWNRNVHRELPSLLEKVIGNMSTTGVDGHDDCHFFHETYVEWGHRMARVVNRDLYGTDIPGNIEAPNPISAIWQDDTHLEIDYGDTGNGLELQPGAEIYFSLSDGVGIAEASVEGTTVVLTTAAPSAATWVSFVDLPGDIPWLVNDLGIGSFAYYQFPITP